MKSYREIADSVFARREQYVIAQRKKKKVLAGAGATLCAVSLLGGSVWYLNRPQHDIPVTLAPDKDEATTTTIGAPTENEDTTTTTTTNTTDGGIVTPPTTTPTTSILAPSQSTTPSKTQSPTVTTTPSKTQPTATTPSKTEPTKTNPTQPTASQTKPTATQTKPTQTTVTTQPTVPPVEDDYIVVETTVSAGEPSPIYMLRASIPTQYNIGTMDEYIPISLSYGCVENTPVEGPPDVVLYFLGEDGEEYIFKRVERQRFLVEYAIRRVWDENRVWVTDYVYSRTETICLPLSLFSDISGRVWIVLADGTSEEKDEIVENGYLYSVASVCFDYVCSGTSIGFSVIDE